MSIFYIIVLYSKSLKCYQAAFNHDNTNSTYLYNQASVYMMMKNYDMAMQICENVYSNNTIYKLGFKRFW